MPFILQPQLDAGVAAGIENFWKRITTQLNLMQQAASLGMALRQLAVEAAARGMHRRAEAYENLATRVLAPLFHPITNMGIFSFPALSVHVDETSQDLIREIKRPTFQQQPAQGAQTQGQPEQGGQQAQQEQAAGGSPGAAAELLRAISEEDKRGILESLRQGKVPIATPEQWRQAIGFVPPPGWTAQDILRALPQPLPEPPGEPLAGAHPLPGTLQGAAPVAPLLRTTPVPQVIPGWPEGRMIVASPYPPLIEGVPEGQLVGVPPEQPLQGAPPEPGELVPTTPGSQITRELAPPQQEPKRTQRRAAGRQPSRRQPTGPQKGRARQQTQRSTPRPISPKTIDEIDISI